MRTLFSKKSKIFVNSFFLKTKYLDFQVLTIIKSILSSLNFFFFLINSYLFSYKVSRKIVYPYTIKRHCILTSRGRSVYVRYSNISRYKFKDLANFGYIPGIQKQ
jgi:ribosomal protein S14